MSTNANTTHTHPQGLTLADAATLPPVLGLRAAAAWLGISPTTAYRLVEHGQFPAPVYRIGASLRVPTAALLAYLGITTTATARADAADGATEGAGVAAPGDPDAPAADGGGTAAASEAATGPAAAAPAPPAPPAPVNGAVSGTVRPGGEPPRRGLYPVGRASVDGPRAG